ncbi:unnamed protein product [Urochloa decumbens]|uniref:Uncharacterized protein n=1 Tax=Urochloa decumbens TaxID=240449 RepID=A0ABC9C2M7_9POAL
MSYRRFLYLVADECADHKFSLRCIDTSRFFFFFVPRPPPELWAPPPTPTPLDSRGGAAAATDPSAAEDAGRLPNPTLSRARARRRRRGEPDPGGGHRRKHRHDPHVVMCDPGPPLAVLPLGTISPKFLPFSLTAGDGSLYVMDLVPKQRRSFKALSYGRLHRHFAKEWYCRTGTPSRRRPSCTATAAARRGTSSPTRWPAAPTSSCPPGPGAPGPSTRRGASGGIRSATGRCRSAASPSTFPETRRFFDVGELRVCPETRRTCMVEGMEAQAVITGVEVESCCGGGDQELRVVRHKSQRYKLDILSYYWVL